MCAIKEMVNINEHDKQLLTNPFLFMARAIGLSIYSYIYHREV